MALRPLTLLSILPNCSALGPLSCPYSCTVSSSRLASLSQPCRWLSSGTAGEPLGTCSLHLGHRLGPRPEDQA